MKNKTEQVRELTEVFGTMLGPHAIRWQDPTSGTLLEVHGERYSIMPEVSYRGWWILMVPEELWPSADTHVRQTLTSLFVAGHRELGAVANMEDGEILKIANNVGAVRVQGFRRWLIQTYTPWKQRREDDVERRLAQRTTPTPVGALRIPVHFDVVPGEFERITKIIADAVTQELGEVEVKVLVTPVFKADEMQVER